MAKELNEDTSFKISIKTLGGIAVLIFVEKLEERMIRIEDKMDKLILR